MDGAVKARIVLSSLIFLLGACDHRQTTASILQKFDALRGEFRTLTAESQRVSADVQHLAQSMQREDEAGVRSRAVGLKADAQSLMTHAGQAAFQVRRLNVGATGRDVRGYLSLTVSILQWDWFEGETLTQLADAAWADPFSTTTRDEQQLSKLSGTARWYAYMAVRSAQSAARWRRRYATAFRYVPVPTSVPKQRGV
jgi:hypothetical protein